MDILQRPSGMLLTAAVAVAMLMATAGYHKEMSGYCAICVSGGVRAVHISEKVPAANDDSVQYETLSDTLLSKYIPYTKDISGRSPPASYTGRSLSFRIFLNK